MSVLNDVLRHSYNYPDLRRPFKLPTLMKPVFHEACCTNTKNWRLLLKLFR